GAGGDRRRRYRHAFPAERSALARGSLRPVPPACGRPRPGARRGGQRGRCDDRLRAPEDRPASCRDDRAGRRDPGHCRSPRQRQGDDDRQARFYRPRRGDRGTSGRHCALAALRAPVRRSLCLPAGHPAVLVATCFGVGFLPITPGSWGSFVALPFAWVIRDQWGAAGLAIAAMIAFKVGWWAAATVARASAVEVPGAVVIDEYAATWLALLAA